jgi:tellurite resistance protein
MTEQFQKLKASIAEVEQQVRSAGALDESARETLEEVISDLRAAVDRQGGPGPFEPESLIERLRAAEENFQVSHPTLSGVVMRMIDALGQLGI